MKNILFSLSAVVALIAPVGQARAEDAALTETKANIVQTLILEKPDGRISEADIARLGAIEGVILPQSNRYFHDSDLLIRVTNKNPNVIAELRAASGMSVTPLEPLLEASRIPYSQVLNEITFKSLVESIDQKNPLSVRWVSASLLLKSLAANGANGIPEDVKERAVLRLMSHEMYLSAVFDELQQDNELKGRREYNEALEKSGREYDSGEMYRRGREYAARNRSAVQVGVASEIRSIITTVPSIGNKESLLWPIQVLRHAQGIGLDALTLEPALLDRFVDAEINALKEVTRQAVDGVKAKLHLQTRNQSNEWQPHYSPRNVPGLNAQRSSVGAGIWASPEMQYFTSGFMTEGGTHQIFGIRLSEAKRSALIEKFADAFVKAEAEAQPVLAKAMREAEEAQQRSSLSYLAERIQDETERREIVERAIQEEMARFDKNGYAKADGFAPVDRLLENFISSRLATNVSYDLYVDGAMRLYDRVLAKTKSPKLREYVIAQGIQLIKSKRALGRQIYDPATRKKAADFVKNLRAQQRGGAPSMGMSCRAIYARGN